MLDSNALKIYVDGSSYKNPGGPGGMAVIVEYPDNFNRPNEEIFKIGFIKTTNNRMELYACIKALDFVRKNIKSLKVCRVLIITDSLYVFDNRNRIYEWRKNNWKNQAGKPIENIDLWKEFLSLMQKTGVPTEFVWKKGKSSEILKEVDKCAKVAAKLSSKIDFGFREGKVGRSKIARAGSSLFSAEGQEAIIRIYHKVSVGKKESKIYFELFLADIKEYTSKYHCYTSVDKSAMLHRGHNYKVVFNNNSDYPTIDEIMGEIN